MANNTNLVIITGNIGKDLEARYTAGGVPVTNLSVAVSKSWKDKNSGEKKEVTLWVEATAWRATAEFLVQYANKGDYVVIQGELTQPNAYIGKDNAPHASASIQILNCELRSKNRDGNGHGEPAYAPPTNMDDIPF